MRQPFTDDEITALSAEIDAELRSLATPGTGRLKGTDSKETLPERQRHAIERVTGEPAPCFLARFKRAAWRDLCHPEGVLYQQWQKYRDVTNKDLLQTFGGVLVGLGLSGNALQIAAVAIAVYVLYIGLSAFCDEASPWS